jgi:hypothetical protein
MIERATIKSSLEAFDETSGIFLTNLRRSAKSKAGIDFATNLKSQKNSF